MFHAVFLLVTTGQFMFFDDPVHIIGNIRSYHQSILGLAIHGLCIYIIIFFFILHQPALVLKHLEIFGSLLIYFRIMFVCSGREINFRFYNMIK